MLKISLFSESVERLSACFDAAVKAERAALKDKSFDNELSRLSSALKAAEKAQSNILIAIAEGAPYASFKTKAEALEQDIETLN